MKIAMLSPIHWRTPPQRYGAWEICVSNLTEGLVKKGFEVTLFATGNSKTKANLISVCPKPIMQKKYDDPKTYEYLHSVLPFEKAKEFDIIHNHYNAYPLVFSSFVKTPIVTTIHGFSSKEIIKIFKKYKQTFYVSVSNADRKNAKGLNYVATVYHGIDTKKFSLGKGGNYLVYVGRISWQKGIEKICEVAKKTGLELLIAGYLPLEEKKYFLKNIKPYLGKKIKYLGEVSETKKVNLLKNALAFLQFNHPKYKGEAFCLSLVEAQSCGTPVIAKKQGPIPEVVKDKKTGFVINSIEEAIYNIKKINKINRNECRNFVLENFTLEKMVNNYVDVYEKVLALTKTS